MQNTCASAMNLLGQSRQPAGPARALQFAEGCAVVIDPLLQDSPGNDLKCRAIATRPRELTKIDCFINNLWMLLIKDDGLLRGVPRINAEPESNVRLNFGRNLKFGADPTVGVRKHSFLELRGDQRVKEIPWGVVARKISCPEVDLLVDVPSGRSIEGTPSGWGGKRGGKYHCRQNESDGRMRNHELTESKVLAVRNLANSMTCKAAEAQHCPRFGQPESGWSKERASANVGE